MSDKVIGLRPNLVIEGDGPDAECVALCEKLLEKARSGEMQGLAVACVGDGGSQSMITVDWKGNTTIGNQGAAIALLHFSFFRAWDDKPPAA